MSFNKADLQQRMDGAINQLQKEYSGLRTGRASTNLLEHVMVEAYGSMMPLNQCGSVSVPEPRMLTVTVWDASISKNVEKAIRDGGLGLNPMAEGTVIRVPVPQLSEERRKELIKVAAKYAEETRIAIRNVRRDGMDNLKKSEKDGEISEDEHKRLSDEVQKLTDGFIKKVDDMLAVKEKDMMVV
jgi:ribosome recycling factor